MQYRIDMGHGLPHDPFKALVAPRPIGWVSTLSPEGKVNLAPYSFFNIVSESPHMVMFSSARRKDSLTNAELTGEFVCSLASFAQARQVVATSAALPYGESEFEHAGLVPSASLVVAPPRVSGAPAALECRYIRTIDLEPLDGAPASHHMVIGQVVAIYIDDAVMKDGYVDTLALQTISRGGYMDYFIADHRFDMKRPVAE